MSNCPDTCLYTLAFVLLQETCFPNCRSRQFFLHILKNVVLDNSFWKLSFWTNTFLQTVFVVPDNFFFENYANLLIWVAFWSGGQGGGQRIEIDQSGQNSQVVWVAEVVRLVGVIRMVVVGMVGMVVRWSGWLGWSA